jgi:hypothetical protein
LTSSTLVLAQSGIAQPGDKPFVAAMGELAIDQQPEPVGMGERGGFVGSFELGKGLGHAGQAKLAQLAEHWMGKHCILLSGSSAVRECWGGGLARHRRATNAPFGDRACCRGSMAPSRRSRADVDRPRGGGFQAIGAEWPNQPHDAEAGAEALQQLTDRRIEFGQTVEAAVE